MNDRFNSIGQIDKLMYRGPRPPKREVRCSFPFRCNGCDGTMTEEETVCVCGGHWCKDCAPPDDAA